MRADGMKTDPCRKENSIHLARNVSAAAGVRKKRAGGPLKGNIPWFRRREFRERLAKGKMNENLQRKRQGSIERSLKWRHT